MTRKRILRIGVRSYEDAKRELRGAVRGETKRDPGAPTIWVTSLASIAQLLSEDNLRLLDTIRTRQPSSVTELAEAVGRALPSVSRTLAAMESYGLVEMVDGPGRQKAPQLAFDELEIVYRLRTPVVTARAIA